MNKIKYDDIFITNTNRIWKIYNKKNTSINPDTIKYINNFIEELNKYKLTLFLQYGIFIPVLFFVYIFAMFIFAVMEILFMLPVIFFLFVFNMFLIGIYEYKKKNYIQSINDIYYMEKNKLEDYYRVDLHVPFTVDSNMHKIKFSFYPLVKSGFKREINQNQNFGNNQHINQNNNQNNNQNTNQNNIRNNNQNINNQNIYKNNRDNNNQNNIQNNIGNNNDNNNQNNIQNNIGNNIQNINQNNNNENNIQNNIENNIQNINQNNNNGNNIGNNIQNNIGNNRDNNIEINQDTINMGLVPNYPDFEDVENNQNPHFK